MQTTVTTLMFVISAVLLACIVINYAVVIFEQTLDTENSPQIERIRNLENMVLNQTDNLINEIELLNQTDTLSVEQIAP